jgi:hypothetical protein
VVAEEEQDILDYQGGLVEEQTAVEMVVFIQREQELLEHAEAAVAAREGVLPVVLLVHQVELVRL